MIKWYSMRETAKELGMSVNTFKKYYAEKFPPDRETQTYKAYTENTLNRIKEHINQGAN
ncbi:hypothetical protein [Acinetobacter sp. c3-l95]|uniref:hypothetical protein n=1 Tax=Acinetobacter sp. c3-l95 TaxID=3342804 RepID=UPI0035B9DBDD